MAALARLYPSGLLQTDIPGWDPEWHGAVYIDLPAGQVSWHYHVSQAHLFDGLPAYAGAWDGHDTPEKYRRLAALSRIVSTPTGGGDLLSPVPGGGEQDGRLPDGTGLSSSGPGPSVPAPAGASIPGAARWPVQIGKETTLAECEVGLFLSDYGTLCLKSEYGNNEGRIDAYIIDSGEFFWGEQPQTIASQRASRVWPVEIDVSAPAIETGGQNPEGSGAEHESAIDAVEAPTSLDQVNPAPTIGLSALQSVEEADRAQSSTPTPGGPDAL